MKRIPLFILITLLVAGSAMAQQRGVPVGDSDEFSYLNPQNYIIGGVTVSGTAYLDNDVLITISKRVVGSSIYVPRDATSHVVKTLRDQGMSDEVEIFSGGVQDSLI